MNRVILMGRLTRDPEVRTYQTQEGQGTSARFTVAVDRRAKQGAEQIADFISCAAFGKNAENISKFFKQGSKILVEGRIQTGSYTNQQGAKVYTTDVMVDSWEFAESKSGVPEAAPQADSNGFMSIPDGVDDEGLPF